MVTFVNSSVILYLLFHVLLSLYFHSVSLFASLVLPLQAPFWLYLSIYIHYSVYILLSSHKFTLSYVSQLVFLSYSISLSDCLSNILFLPVFFQSITIFSLSFQQLLYMSLLLHDHLHRFITAFNYLCFYLQLSTFHISVPLIYSKSVCHWVYTPCRYYSHSEIHFNKTITTVFLPPLLSFVFL